MSSKAHAPEGVRCGRQIVGTWNRLCPRAAVTLSEAALTLAKVTGKRRRRRGGDALSRERARRAADAAKKATAGRGLKVVVATTPQRGDQGPALQRDITLVKAALLYADQVELVSPTAAMLGGMAFVADRGEPALLEVLQALDDRTMRALGGRELPANWRSVLPMLDQLRRLDPAHLLAIPGLAELADQLASFDAVLRDSADEFTARTEQMLTTAGAEELVPAIEAGVLILSPAGLAENLASTSDMVDNFLDIVTAHLADPRSRLMFDDDLAGVVHSMIREGVIEPNHLALTHAGQAAVGSGLVTRLPAFTSPPMTEVLDLRRDLHDPLTSYRAAVARLADQLTARAYEPENAAEIDDLWVSEVQPALVRMRQEMADHGLIRELARDAATRPDVLVRAATGPGAYLGLETISTLSGWATAAAGVAAATLALGQMAGQAAHRARTERAQVERHDLFYLFELERRL